MTVPLPGPIDTYTRMQVETASHARLVCLLHNQCVLHLRQAELTESSRRDQLNRAQNILVLLQQSLKNTDATSRTLFHLYDYCYCLLEKGNDSEIINAGAILDILRQTFDHLQKHPR